MTTLVGIFDQPEQVEAVVQQLGLAHITATSVTRFPAKREICKRRFNPTIRMRRQTAG